MPKVRKSLIKYVETLVVYCDRVKSDVLISKYTHPKMGESLICHQRNPEYQNVKGCMREAKGCAMLKFERGEDGKIVYIGE